MLISTPVYAALGRIRRILFIDGKLFDLPALTTAAPAPAATAATPFGPFSKVVDSYADIHRVIQHKDIAMDIIFDQRRPAGATDVENFGYHLLPAPAGVSILTRWAQDLIHFVPEAGLPDAAGYKALFFQVFDDNNRPVLIQDWIARMLVEKVRIPQTHDSQFVSSICPAGNMLRGYHDPGDYLLVGHRSQCHLTDLQIAEYFNVAPHRVIDASVNVPPLYLPFFFHTDLYLSILGKSDKEEYKGKEIILAAEACGASEIDNFSDVLDQAIARIAHDHPFIQPVRIPYPFMTVSDENGQPTLKGYPYSNCHVENYRDLNGRRVLNIYFPKFHDVMQKDYAEVHGTGNSQLLASYFDDLGNAVNDLAPASPERTMALTAFSNQEPTDETKHNWIIETLPLLYSSIETRLRDIGEQLGATVNFIPHRFDELSDAQGSLHCLSKVTERDRVYLE